ncbi:rhodanese-like domain-containing protein [Humisphaera borealis]|uniref:Rhodanese-like domain-containing protein n=1 Tax=Humisphaera borealis TaxID=2807512 RepID=A0A7M2WUH6_9BACT|nr:rhodanese-like domain-containing protein [Humisphaera borealis]QOV89158.1 rhodanese-like domain-containing protein [Humisphaera borealis]
MRCATPLCFVLLTLTCFTAPAWSADEKKPEPSAVTKSSPDQFDKARHEKDAVVIDVRSPEEFAAGRVPGAVNIPVTGAGSEAFDKRVAEVAKDKTPLVYCRSGNRSAKAVEKLKAMGFRSIIEMPGGWVAWSQAGKDVEKGPVKPAK